MKKRFEITWPPTKEAKEKFLQDVDDTVAAYLTNDTLANTWLAMFCNYADFGYITQIIGTKINQDEYKQKLLAPLMERLWATQTKNNGKNYSYDADLAKKIKEYLQLQKIYKLDKTKKAIIWTVKDGTSYKTDRENETDLNNGDILKETEQQEIYVNCFITLYRYHTERGQPATHCIKKTFLSLIKIQQDGCLYRIALFLSFTKLIRSIDPETLNAINSKEKFFTQSICAAENLTDFFIRPLA